MNRKLIFAGVSMVVADLIALVITSDYKLKLLAGRFIEDHELVPFLAPPAFLCVFLVVTAISDMLWRFLDRRIAPQAARMTIDYRVNAKAPASTGPSNWVFREAWDRKKALIKTIVLAVLAAVVLSGFFFLLSLFAMLLLGPLKWLDWVLSAIWILSAHVNYLASFIIVTVDDEGLRVTRFGARDQGRIDMVSIDRVRAVGGLVLVPYGESMWLKQPLEETKGGRYAVLRPTEPAKLIVQQMRQARERHQGI